MKLLDEALRYAAAGIPVFPLHWVKQDGNCSCRQGAMCTAKGKHPRIKNWNEEATTDPEKIKSWWEKTPSANIGIPMGERTGLVALDVDTRHGGEDSLAMLMDEFDILPDTITATTGGGGKHYIFKYTEKLCLKNVVGFRDGLDIRTQGGMIVAAPSVHSSGRQYTWDSGKSPFDMQAADMPAWLVEEIRKVGTKFTVRKKAAEPAPRKKISEGGRNNHLTSLAGALRRKGIGEEGIIATLRAENRDRLAPPLDDDAVMAIAKSITRYQPEAESIEYKLTDVGNAERFVAMFKDQVKYCTIYKKWFIWNGKRWEQDDTGKIITYAIECVRNIIHDADLLPDGDRRKALIQHSLKSESNSRLKALLDIASGMPAITVRSEDLDQNVWLLNCQNGTIDLRTGKLQPHDPKDFITRICSAEYNPTCAIPLWKQLMEKITGGDKEYMRYIQKALGYALTGDISEQAIFILYGTGSNGKSTMLNVKYVDNTVWNTVPTDEDGEGSATLPDGTEIEISNADKTKGQLVIDPITDKEALDWINSVTDGKVKAPQAYHIYYLENNGNMINANGISVSMKPGDTLQTPVVYSLKSDGSMELLSADVKNGTITFTTDGSPYYVLGEKASGGTPSDPGDSPQTGDNSHMALWIALLAVSVFALAGTAVYSRRKRGR